MSYSLRSDDDEQHRQVMNHFEEARRQATESVGSELARGENVQNVRAASAGDVDDSGRALLGQVLDEFFPQCLGL